MNKGLLWYRYDVRFLRRAKIRAIAHKAGAASRATVATITAIMAEIYGGEGYYMLFEEWMADQIAVDAFLGEGGADDVRAVVSAALDVGFFDKGIFETFGVLTSKEIQAEWLDSYRLMKKKGIETIIESAVKPEIWLLPRDETGKGAGNDTSPAGSVEASGVTSAGAPTWNPLLTDGALSKRGKPL